MLGRDLSDKNKQNQLIFYDILFLFIIWVVIYVHADFWNSLDL